MARLADTAIRLLGEGPAAGREEISGAELRDLVAANTVLKAEERRLIDDVLSAGRRPIREVMVPRTEVLFLAANLTVSRALRQVRDVEHSRYPVVEETNDNVIGFVRMRDLLVRRDGDRTVTVGQLSREIKHLPTSKRLVDALSELRGEGFPMAVVVDEYGGTAGIVTMEDLIEELVGEIRDELAVADPVVGTPPEVPGLTNLADLAERTGLRLPDGPYETVGGYLMATLGKVPSVGDRVEVAGWQLSVLALDGRRVDRVGLVEHPEAGPAPARPAGAVELPASRAEASRAE
ncbi:MAG: hemolysin family protein, partial [Actinocatenispora sp.]